MEKVNLNLIQPNVVGQFDEVLEIADGSKVFIQWENNTVPDVKFNKSLCYGNGINDTEYILRVPRENKKIKALAILCRTSVNQYICTGYNRQQVIYGRFANLTEVSDYLANNYCNTLLKMGAK